MQGLQRYPSDVVRLDLTPTPTTTAAATTTTRSNNSSSSCSSSSSLSIDAIESAETKIQRLISEHPVIIFSRTSCCMCHVMKNLLATIGVHPTVIELEDSEISALPTQDDNSSFSSSSSSSSSSSASSSPAVFIGGTCVGGLESLVKLHLSGLLVPKLVEVGALWV
ncbi:glutaredoxin-C6 [Ricinus communis]|uniref:Glutaredoxin, grx, putative n=1 Tax=Ricinus communis TaxID=3988 RepID=B9RRQ5_RICCO|nr:glutaredoxin-C6 [Ricinus communis]EEF45765.1 glutaredoxin, grx, putative [Ricinus communis]|eukprot:XP_002516424.1 glutaredoxin-C6 [Ricinus communis]